jgi:hypothetical protein
LIHAVRAVRIVLFVAACGVTGWHLGGWMVDWLAPPPVLLHHVWTAR